MKIHSYKGTQGSVAFPYRGYIISVSNVYEAELPEVLVWEEASKEEIFERKGDGLSLILQAKETIDALIDRENLDERIAEARAE